MWIGSPSLVLRTDCRARRRTRTEPLLRARRGGLVAPSLTPGGPVIPIREDNPDSGFRITGGGCKNAECPMFNDQCSLIIQHWTFAWRSWRRPTLPRPRDRSTIGADRLNDRVRDGNGCGPVALVASKLETSDLRHQTSDVRRPMSPTSVCCGIEDHAEHREEIKPHGQLVRLG